MRIRSRLAVENIPAFDAFNTCINIGPSKNMSQGKSSVIIKILAIAAIYIILVFLLVQMIRMLENWSQIYP